MLSKILITATMPFLALQGVEAVLEQEGGKKTSLLAKKRVQKEAEMATEGETMGRISFSLIWIE